MVCDVGVNTAANSVIPRLHPAFVVTCKQQESLLSKIMCSMQTYMYIIIISVVGVKHKISKIREHK